MDAGGLLAGMQLQDDIQECGSSCQVKSWHVLPRACPLAHAWHVLPQACPLAHACTANTKCAGIEHTLSSVSYALSWCCCACQSQVRGQERGAAQAALSDAIQTARHKINAKHGIPPAAGSNAGHADVCIAESHDQVQLG